MYCTFAVWYCTTDAEGKGCFTMTDLYNFRGEWNDGKSKGPVFVLGDDNNVDYYPDSFTGKWLLTSELYVTGGGTKVYLCRYSMPPPTQKRSRGRRLGAASSRNVPKMAYSWRTIVNLFLAFCGKSCWIFVFGYSKNKRHVVVHVILSKHKRDRLPTISLPTLAVHTNSALKSTSNRSAHIMFFRHVLLPRHRHRGRLQRATNRVQRVQRLPRGEPL